MSSVEAVILAAGKGTRMRSERAKVLHEVLGVSLIEHVVTAALAAPVDHVCVVIGHEREAVAAQIAASFDAAQVATAIQEEQLGTGHAVWSARSAFASLDGYVLILSGDVPNLSAQTLATFIAHARSQRALLCVMSAVVEDASGYGRIVRDAEGRVTRIVEQLDATEQERAIRELNTGTYLIDAAFLREGLDALMAAARQNAKNEYYLTDLVARAAAARDGGASAWILSDAREAQGVNTRADLASASSFARARINDRWMRHGVEIIDPLRTIIGARVELEPDVVLYPDVTLEGATRVEAGALIDQGCVLRDAHIGPRAHIKPHCVITSSRVGARSEVGPFAHLRPDSELGVQCKVGNFVEIKKTVMADGAKASHLSYLGDAHIGAGANVGAGTITCNYDGASKHETHIGAGAFVGSNSSLVAPVRIGDDAYVAAGSVITSEVPAEALGVARERQRNIEGWARRKKKPS